MVDTAQDRLDNIERACLKDIAIYEQGLSEHLPLVTEYQGQLGTLRGILQLVEGKEVGPPKPPIAQGEDQPEPQSSEPGSVLEAAKELTEEIQASGILDSEPDTDTADDNTSNSS